jgi:subtilisin family serine protease
MYVANSVLETALRNLVKSGVFLAAAAGNSGADGCHKLPASVPTAMVVAATDQYDKHASFSSSGPCVDIYAPGKDIRSLLPTGVGWMSGTSMASPHVAGVAALYLQTRPTALPATVKSKIESWATTGTIGGVPAGTVNRLLYTNGL